FIVLLFLTILVVNSFSFTEGYQGAIWGMSRDEVKKAFPDKKFQEASGNLLFEDIILSDDAIIGFYFLKNQLYNVIIQLREVANIDFPEIKSAGNKFNEVLEILKQKYGTPSRLKNTINMEYIDDDFAIGTGQGSYFAVWKTQESEITLLLTKMTGSKVALMVKYENPYFASLHKKAEKQEAIENKF
ncbi:MAG: hypothetical protein KJ864_02350, partial [Candidatus Omnitrophica bacterium]|nr:hypothetical protein [Candidatus Omnitrophota bacterium]